MIAGETAMCKINFVSEFKEFMRYAMQNGLSARERNLWIALFYLANDRARYNEQTGDYDWPDDFFLVANSELNLHSTLDKRGADGELIGVDDNAVCIYEMSGGIMGTMTASWTYYGAEDNSTILYGDKGIMRIYDDPEHSIVVKLADGSKIMYDVEQIQTNDNQTKSGVIDRWMNCLTTNTPPEISGESALYAMRAIFASIRSSETGQTVAIPENE